MFDCWFTDVDLEQTFQRQQDARHRQPRSSRHSSLRKHTQSGHSVSESGDHEMSAAVMEISLPADGLPTAPSEVCNMINEARMTSAPNGDASYMGTPCLSDGNFVHADIERVCHELVCQAVDGKVSVKYVDLRREVLSRLADLPLDKRLTYKLTDQRLFLAALSAGAVATNSQVGGCVDYLFDFCGSHLLSWFHSGRFLSGILWLAALDQPF